MAIFFRLACGECDETVVFKKDKYVHYSEAYRGVKSLHKVDQRAIKNYRTDEKKEKADA
jgi:hypothetical protein